MKRLIATTLLVILGGCGYSQSGGENNKQQGGYHWNSLYREDIQTVAVPVFTTRDYRRGIEFRLTEAVIKQLELHAPYKVVPKERADTILEGQVVSVKVGTLSRDFQNNLPREQELVITRSPSLNLNRLCSGSPYPVDAGTSMMRAV